MEIKKIEIDKKQFLNLLLLADEQENMIDRYLHHGDMFALYDGDLNHPIFECGIQLVDMIYLKKAL